MANSQPSPFTNFHFSVEISVGSIQRVCEAAFSECDGLEMTMEVKTLREGGNNARQLRLSGPVAYGQLTLKRGVTPTTDLWDWFNSAILDPSLRADAHVVMFKPDGKNVAMSFVLERCVPVKLKAPAMSAAGGGVAIEELQVAYEQLTFQKPR